MYVTYPDSNTDCLYTPPVHLLARSEARPPSITVDERQLVIYREDRCGPCTC